MKFTNDTLMFGSIPIKKIYIDQKDNPIILVNNTEYHAFGIALAGIIGDTDMTGKILMYNTFAAKPIKGDVALLPIRDIFGVVALEDNEVITEYKDMYNEPIEPFLGLHNKITGDDK